MCIVLKNNKKCEFCIRHERSCNVVFAADHKKISISQNFALLIIIRRSCWSCYKAYKNLTFNY